MTQSAHAPVLIIGGSGMVGARTAHLLRKLAPALALRIAGRDASKAAAVAREVGGPTEACTVDLSRDDLALPSGGDFSAVLLFVKDPGARALRFAQSLGVPYLSFSDFPYDLAPTVAMFARAPRSAPVLLLGNMVGGLATLAALHFAKELRTVTSITVAGVIAASDAGGPAARAEFAQHTGGGHGALVRRDGAWTWLKDADTARVIVDRAGVERTAHAWPLPDVASLAAATNASSVRADVAVRDEGDEDASTEVIVEIAGERADGTHAIIRGTLVDDDVHARLSAYGAALATERLLGLRGAAVEPGLYGPENILEPSAVIARLLELGVRVDLTSREAMPAVVLDRWGDIDALTLRTMPLPELGDDEVLIRVDVAGLGSWDREERAGLYAEYLGAVTFPYVLGWEGAGTVAAVGSRVDHVREGDRVYAVVFPRQSGGGFYARYAAVKAVDVAHVPASLTLTQAGAMGWDALTALTGLDDVLRTGPGKSLMIFGASGGIGHLALQLAKRMGARVLAVASGDDGVAMAQRLGADAVVDGRKGDVLSAARSFAADGVDACLVTAGGAERALEGVRKGGVVAYPNGVQPKPSAPPGVQLVSYDALRGHAAFAKLHRLIATAPFEIHVARTFALHQVADAHRALDAHYLGKLALVMA